MPKNLEFTLAVPASSTSPSTSGITAKSVSVNRMRSLPSVDEAAAGDRNSGASEFPLVSSGSPAIPSKSSNVGAMSSTVAVTGRSRAASWKAPALPNDLKLSSTLYCVCDNTL